METHEARSHEPRLVRHREAHRRVHRGLNAQLAIGITRGVGSMWCAYAFGLLALISFPAAIQSGDPIVIVAWIAQTFLQLVLLPVIIVGQNVQAEANDQRAEADHKTLSAIHHLSGEIHEINERQTEMLEEVRKSLR